MQEPDDLEIQEFINTVKSFTAYDFSNYSISSLKRRVAKVLLENQMKMDQLTERIKSDFGFTEELVKSITVCTTELFRDPEMWVSLKNEMLNHCIDKETINIWHAGCSTGQEIYSMMILLNEAGILDKCNIYASDINRDAMEQAASGKYKYMFNKNYLENFDAVFNNTTEAHVPYNKYFIIDQVRDIIQMESFLTQKPVFKKTDLVKDENPFNVIFDVIICRNVIIYFNFELQNRVFNLFYRNLKENSCIILGSHESIIGPYSNVFKKKFHGYFKKINK